MARNIHWRIQFRTRSEKLGVLNLYEENYSGEVVELTPAAVPFETQEDSSDKWFEPIRKQSGYIRVLDEGNTEGIMPVGMMDRYVEYREDDVLQWCGYMVPDVYSSDWDVTPLEVEFPVVGGLGVIEGVYLNEDDGLGVVPLARLLYDALKATGVDYSTIIFPKEVLQNESATDYLYPMRLEVSRYNFFQDNDSLNSEDSDWTRYNGETHYNVLSEVMRFFGWTIHERGSEICITSTNNEGSVWLTWGELEGLANGSSSINGNRSASVNTYDLADLELAGADHKRDILQGRKKVVVKASVNPVGAVIPSVDKTKMKLGLSYVSDLNVNGNVYAHEKRKQYVPKESYTDVVLRSYAKSTPLQGELGEWVEFKNQVYDMDGWSLLQLYVGAYFVEREFVDKNAYEKKKNWNLTESIMIKTEGWDYFSPNEQERANMKFMEIRSRRIASYTHGAFVISATTKSIYQTVGFQQQERNGAGKLEVRFKVGDKFWNGEGWGTDDVWFLVEMGNEEDPSVFEGTGKIINTKTLDMPYDGADGYIMPITEPLNGEVEMDLRMVFSYMDLIYQVLENLKVDYYGLEDDEKKNEDSENRYAKTTGLNYTNEEEISLKMATNNNNKAGYGILSRYGENVDSLYFVGKGMLRPEMNLVNKGISLYGRSTEKLTLQLDKISVRPHDVILWEGKKYLLASEAVNWAEETGQYIFMSLNEE